MSIQTLTKGVGGTLETYFLDRQVSTCTVTVRTGEGGIKLDATAATVDTVATTITTQGSAKATSLALSSAAGVVVGRRYLLGGVSASQPREAVSVKDLTASTATLWAPLRYNHASGTTFKGTRVSYAVASTVCDATWWGGWADWTPNSGDVQTETVDCTLRKIPEYGCDEADIQQVFPKEGKILDAELDMPRAIKQARDWFLIDLGGKTRAHTFMGADHFRQPIAYKFWLLRRPSMGAEWKDILDELQKDYDRMVTQIQSQVPADVDQDGTTTGQNDGGFTVGTLERA